MLPSRPPLGVEGFEPERQGRGESGHRWQNRGGQVQVRPSAGYVVLNAHTQTVEIRTPVEYGTDGPRLLMLLSGRLPLPCSLLLALLRLVEPRSGSIVVDGVDTRKLGLHDLRSHFSIIPQVRGLIVAIDAEWPTGIDVVDLDAAWNALYSGSCAIHGLGAVQCGPF